MVDRKANREAGKGAVRMEKNDDKDR